MKKMKGGTLEDPWLERRGDTERKRTKFKGSKEAIKKKQCD